MIEKIFTSKTRIKILEFLFFKKNETYIRDISKNLKMPVSGVKREVDDLESIGIIKMNSYPINLFRSRFFMISISMEFLNSKVRK